MKVALILLSMHSDCHASEPSSLLLWLKCLSLVMGWKLKLACCAQCKGKNHDTSPYHKCP